METDLRDFSLEWFIPEPPSIDWSEYDEWVFSEPEEMTVPDEKIGDFFEVEFPN